jgi:uncharacterized DUF497 family protein
MRFEWDANKAWANFLKHGVGFDEATEVFYDPNAVERYDSLHSDDESRFSIIGLSSRWLLYVAYSERARDTVRLISARKATGTERELYERRMVQ